MPRTDRFLDSSSAMGTNEARIEYLAVHGLAVWLNTGGVGLYERVLRNERDKLLHRRG